MNQQKLDLPQGTLDLMVLQALSVMARRMGTVSPAGLKRIEQVSGDQILLKQGTIYASLVRLKVQGSIPAEWGTSGNDRKAKFYPITGAGRKQLAADLADWERLVDVLMRVVSMKAEGEAR